MENSIQPPAQRSAGAGLFLYATTIFLSAFLLFQVQPVIARMILPWFGGSAAVWTTCMLFFQIVLLLGYLYVHWGVRTLTPRNHAYLHIGLLVVSLAVLPITPGVNWKPAGGQNPSAQILLLLAACVGAPYFLLSTTSPLLQSWYARSGKGVLPYRLFALSNFGSMLALISYPILVEPNLPSRMQGSAWSFAYVLFVALCAASGLTSIRGASAPASTEPGDPEDAAEAVAPTAGSFAMWISLAACPSALLLGVTTHLTQDVAAIPFLWVAPLILYLLTFILCFDSDGWYRRPIFLPLLAPALGGMAYLLWKGTEDFNMKILLSVFCASFFVCCMVCHGEMVKRKPHPKFLTGFYLALSVGGAIGGLFVGLVAPYLFNSYYEFPIAIVFCGFIAVAALVTDPKSRFYEGWGQWQVVLMVGAVLMLAIFVGRTVKLNVGEHRIVARNFYGSLRIRDDGDPNETNSYRTLLHGAINHGEEYVHPTRRREPLTYYCRDTGAGRAIRTRQEGVPQTVGVFGLGAGSLGGYARAGDHYKFYEINPMVRDLAMTEFFFLKESPAKAEVVLGDARLSLEREPKNDFDVLAVDCFSGDSIPVHLLTKEAIQLYFAHLKPNGILAIHVSNRYLDLEPVIERVTSNLGKQVVQIETEDDGDEGNCFSTTWVLVANSAEVFKHKVFDGSLKTVEVRQKLRMWTDDYSSLIGVLR
ncbi:MAG: fused MFS/spermidine synthase [Acidobacteria bacterium]|nr:fused MFS/spermidine synthase [Acidobacteriota bacterium]